MEHDQVSYWMGKDVNDMTHDELKIAFHQLGQMYGQLQTQYQAVTPHVDYVSLLTNPAKNDPT